MEQRSGIQAARNGCRYSTLVSVFGPEIRLSLTVPTQQDEQRCVRIFPQSIYQPCACSTTAAYRRLDSLGLVGFAHDFESLKGDYCIVTAAFYALRAPHTNSPSDLIFRLASSTMPILRNIPTAKNRIIQDFRAYMGGIAGDILERNDAQETKAQGSEGTEDKSILGLLSMCSELPDQCFCVEIIIRLQLNPWRKTLRESSDCRMQRLWPRYASTIYFFQLFHRAHGFVDGELFRPLNIRD